MPTFEIICLAKSIKHRGLCIAGMKTDGSGWLRPVSNKSDGTLYPEDYTLDDGSEPQIFDIIRIPCVRQEAKSHQPENWVIHPNNSWEIIGTLTLNQAQQLLNPEIQKHSSSGELLGGSDREVSYESLQQSALQSSLALVNPNEIIWEYTTYQNKKKLRANFLLGAKTYNLPITDPIWQNKLEKLGEGKYSCQRLIEELELEHFKPEQFLLTISISEPFIPSGQEKEFCYKLIVAVTNVGDIKKRFGWT